MKVPLHDMYLMDEMQTRRVYIWVERVMARIIFRPVWDGINPIRSSFYPHGVPNGTFKENLIPIILPICCACGT